MSVACRCECGSGEDSRETVDPANPSKKVGRHAIVDPDEPGAAIERANAAQRDRAHIPGPERPQRPAIRGDVRHESIADREEIFGPVLSVLECDTLDQATEMLNGTEFGLTSARFSGRNDQIQRFLAESQNGMIHVNHGTVQENDMPSGGIRNPGAGARSIAPTAANFCTSGHSAHVAW